jgi:hypothetical protein
MARIISLFIFLLHVLDTGLITVRRAEVSKYRWNDSLIYSTKYGSLVHTYCGGVQWHPLNYHLTWYSCDDLLTNSGNWPTPHLNHQFCGVDQYHNLLTNTTVGICLAYCWPIAVSFVSWCLISGKLTISSIILWIVPASARVVRAMGRN